MEFIPAQSVRSLENPGVVSRQLLTPANSHSERVTLTQVTLQPGASQPRHTHLASEQIWLALAGSGSLLLAGEEEHPFAPGDVVRFAPGDVHGLRNTGPGEFTYLAVTSPPLDFSAAYAKRG